MSVMKSASVSINGEADPKAPSVFTSWILPATLITTLVWAYFTAPDVDAVALRWLVSATLLLIAHLASLELATWQSPFQRALAWAALLTGVFAGTLLVLAKLYTHHRPLGAVTVAVTSVAGCVGLALLLSYLRKLPLPAAIVSYAPYAWLLAWAMGMPHVSPGTAFLGTGLGVGLRLATPLLGGRHVPRWLGWSLMAAFVVGTWLSAG
jgi:hypothetical protein